MGKAGYYQRGVYGPVHVQIGGKAPEEKLEHRRSTPPQRKSKLSKLADQYRPKTVSES